METLKREAWKYMCRNGKAVGGEEQWSQLGGKHVLLVLDDVSTERDVKPFLEIAESFSMQSRLIATSREKDVFNPFADVYEVPFLDESSAQHLFTKYAFQEKEIPPPKLAQLMTQIVKKCEGLPLTLEVLGQFLKRKRNEEDWKQTLAALHEADDYVENLNERLWMKLRPSFEGLNEKAQQMFLDATTQFYDHRLTLREALAVWGEAYGVRERLIWQTLVDRSLVYDVEEDVKIKVHEQLRSLGRKIANESNGNIHIRMLEDVNPLESTNEEDEKNIHALGIRMDPRGGEDYHAGQSIADDGNSDELRHLGINGHDKINGTAEAISFPSRLVLLRCVGIKTLNLAHQSRLAVLHISGVESLLSALQQLSALRIFTLIGSSLKSIPEEIAHLSKLEILDISRCVFVTLPESFGHLAALVELNFYHCDSLKSLPHTFGQLSALRRLQFVSCHLQSLPDSFGKLSALNYLRFRNCDGLESLPESFGLLCALVDLKFEDCGKLESLPKTFGHLPALSRLELKRCNRLRSLPESLGNLPSLRHLKLSDCKGLHPLRESLGRFAKLEYFEIDHVKELDRLPDWLAELGSLHHLAIGKLLSLKSIPDSIQTLPSLHTLELGLLPQVRELPPWLGETGVNYLGMSRKVFRKQGRHFFLTRDEIDFDSLKFDTGWAFDFVGLIQSRAIQKVKTSDFEEALAELEVTSLRRPELGIFQPGLVGFQLQEKGIIKRMMGDLLGALEDLTGAVACFSQLYGSQYSYDSWKHRGYVKFLMGDIEGAESDGTMALRLQLNYSGSVLSKYGHVDSLGDECVEYMHFRLDTLRAMEQHERLLISTVHEVLQKVKAADFEGALARFDVINILLLRRSRRSFFLEERGVLKRLAGDLDGALEDLTAAGEIWDDDLTAAGEFWISEYHNWKHRSYVKYLLGDVDGARLDAERCLQARSFSRGQSLAAASVAFMEYNLE